MSETNISRYAIEDVKINCSFELMEVFCSCGVSKDSCRPECPNYNKKETPPSIEVIVNIVTPEGDRKELKVIGSEFYFSDKKPKEKRYNYIFENLPPAKYQIGQFIRFHNLIYRIDGINGCRILNPQPEARYFININPFGYNPYTIPSHICLREDEIFLASEEEVNAANESSKPKKWKGVYDSVQEMIEDNSNAID